MKWTVLHATVVEADSASEAEQKALAWYRAVTLDGLEAHRMCGHPIQGDVQGCPCHVSTRSPEGTYSLIHNIGV